MPRQTATSKLTAFLKFIYREKVHIYLTKNKTHFFSGPLGLANVEP